MMNRMGETEQLCVGVWNFGFYFEKLCRRSIYAWFEEVFSKKQLCKQKQWQTQQEYVTTHATVYAPVLNRGNSEIGHIGCKTDIQNRINHYRLLFASEDRLCANLCVQEQSTNMTSQCQYPMFAWRDFVTREIIGKSPPSWPKNRYSR